MNCEQTKRNHCNINYPDPKELLILWQFFSNVPSAGTPLCVFGAAPFRWICVKGQGVPGRDNDNSFDSHFLVW